MVSAINYKPLIFYKHTSACISHIIQITIKLFFKRLNSHYFFFRSTDYCFHQNASYTGVVRPTNFLEIFFSIFKMKCVCHETMPTAPVFCATAHPWFNLHTNEYQGHIQTYMYIVHVQLTNYHKLDQTFFLMFGKDYETIFVSFLLL